LILVVVLKKGSKYLDNRNNKKERCAEKSESVSIVLQQKKSTKPTWVINTQ